MSEYTFDVTGMTCGHCVMTVTEAISSVPGVAGVQVDLASGRAAVTGSEVDAAAVADALAAVGYGTR